ncbi:MAG: hypothetical protein AAF557_21475 [Pseudomonadota bacterium]
MRYAVLIVGLMFSACADPPPKPSGVQERVSGAYQPTGQDRVALYARMTRYWAAIDAGDLEKAYDFHTYDFRERLPFPAWTRQLQKFAEGTPKPVRIHWTKGVHRHHGPELYAIVDWVAGPDGAATKGRLIWRQEDDGVFWVEN